MRGAFLLTKRVELSRHRAQYHPISKKHMKKTKGNLIVIEGIDGTGKATQANLLLARLAREGFAAEKISFPQYGNPSAYSVEKYLRGEYGPSETVSPRRASTFYAHDRHDAMPRIKQLLNEGVVLVADRYVLANAGHQGGKISDPAERRKFLDWLYEYEHEILGAVWPDINIILTLDPTIAQKRVEQKKGRGYLGGKSGSKDIHEADANHLANAQNSYLWIAQQYPSTHTIIDGCADDGRELTIEEVHERVWNAVRNILKT